MAYAMCHGFLGDNLEPDDLMQEWVLNLPGLLKQFYVAG
jgi:hypothetical protein